MYTEAEARKLVVEAGKKLLESGLTARTWGNISARISSTEFIITPSGRAYEDLKPEELVKVKIEDLSYKGKIKPSSEKGIHAGVYLIRENINFVIHTHQHYASAICAEEEDTPFAPCAKYAVPGSKALKEKVMYSVGIHPEANAFLMAKHGALCLGKDAAEAFQQAFVLESNSKKLFDAKSAPAKKYKYQQAWLDDYAQLVGTGVLKSDPEKADDPAAVKMIVAKNNAAAEYVTYAKPLSAADAAYQRAFYVLKYSKLKTKNKNK